MKSILFAFKLILFVHIVKAQFFEGTITYQVNIYPKNKEIDKIDLKINFGDELKVSIKKNYYKVEVYSNKLLQHTKIYNSDKNKIFTLGRFSPYIFWESSLQTNDTLQQLVFTDETMSFRNHKCKILYLESNNKMEMMLIDEKVRVNPDLFEHHKSEFLSDILKATQGGIILEIITETEDYELRISMLEITEESIDNNSFSFHDSIPVIPHLNELDIKPEISDNHYKNLKRINFIKYFTKCDVYPQSFYLYIYFFLDEKGMVSNIDTYPIISQKFNNLLLKEIYRRGIIFSPGFIDKSPTKSSLILPVIVIH